MGYPRTSSRSDAEYAPLIPSLSDRRGQTGGSTAIGVLASPNDSIRSHLLDATCYRAPGHVLGRHSWRRGDPPLPELIPHPAPHQSPFCHSTPPCHSSLLSPPRGTRGSHSATISRSQADVSRTIPRITTRHTKKMSETPSLDPPTSQRPMTLFEVAFDHPVAVDISDPLCRILNHLPVPLVGHWEF